MKKRILSLLLAVVMIMAMVPVHAHAAECDHSVISANQTYDGTNRHYGRCSKCRQYVYVDCNTNGYASDYNGHYQACSVCGRKASNTATAHTWAYAQGSNGAGYHKQYCSVCNYVSSNNGYCSYSGQPYITENGQHWQVCTVCGLAGKKTTCSSWNGAQPNGDGTHSITCSTCKVAATVDCTYGSYSSNGSSGHRKQCSVCYGYTETVAHTNFSYEYDYSGQHKKICADCGYFIAYENCSYGAYTVSGTQHSHTCSLCNKTVTENHSFDYSTKKCVCGAEKHDHNWVLSVSGNKITAACTGATGTCEYNKNGGSLTITASDVDYDGSEKPASVTNTLNTGSYYDSNYTVSYYKKTTNGYSSMYGRPTDAGEYKATVCSTLDSSKVASVEYKIRKVTKEVAATGWTGEYDGEAHGITVNAPEGLRVTYSKTGNDYDYSYSAPTFSDAGEYTVYYKVEGNNNYEIVNGTGSATVKINPIEVTVTASGYEGTYDGEAHGITVNAPEGLTVTYSETGKDYTYSTYAPTYTNAGEYTVYYKVTGSDNYKINDAAGSAVVKINPANLADLVSAEDYTGTYDGKGRTITVNAPEGTTVSYSADGERWYYSAPTFTEVGTYTVYYKVVANSDNYIADAAKAATAPTLTGSGTVKIEPMDLASVVTASDAEFTFNRYDHTTEGGYTYHSIVLNVDSSKVYDSYNLVKEFSTDGGATWSTQNPAFVNAGVYTVNYRVYVRDYNASNGKDANYIGVEGSKTVTINKAELPITRLVGYHGPYDGSTHYGFGYEYTTSYGSYFTTYWYNYLHEELNYSFSWKDENGAAKSLVVKAGEEPSLRDFPGFTKQNVAKVDPSKDTTDPGVHKVTVTIGSDNYNDKTFTYYVQIGPGGATAEDTTYTYDGDEHYIANYIFGQVYYGYGEIYNRGSVKIQYKEAGTTQWLNANQEPGQTEVGYKDVDWKVTMDSDGNGVFGEEKNSFGSSEVFTGTNRVTVTAVSLTATANDKTITYGDAPAGNGVTISGTYVSPDTEAVVNKSGLTYTYNYAQYGNVGTYSITPSGLTATNYSFDYASGTLTVVAKPVTILADDSQESGFAVKAADLVNGDTCTVTAVSYKDANGNDVANPTAPGTYTATVTLSNSNYVPANTVEVVIGTPDTTAPTGNINVGTNNWNSLQSSITFDIYFKEAKSVTITASDETDGSGVKTIEYLVSNAAMTQAQLAALSDSAWAEYDAAFSLAPNQKVIVYAKITDNAGNVAYISSNGMVYDNVAPDVDGIADRKQYTNGAKFTVSDNYELHSVTVDGKVVKPNSNGEYTIKSDNKYHTVIVTDKAGNQTRLLIVTGEIPEVETPETGDTFNLVLWGCLMLASAAALAYVVVSKRRTTKK